MEQKAIYVCYMILMLKRDTPPRHQGLTKATLHQFSQGNTHAVLNAPVSLVSAGDEEVHCGTGERSL